MLRRHQLLQAELLRTWLQALLIMLLRVSAPPWRSLSDLLPTTCTQEEAHVKGVESQSLQDPA
jgi:hypothetical protein